MQIKLYAPVLQLLSSRAFCLSIQSPTSLMMASLCVSVLHVMSPMIGVPFFVVIPKPFREQVLSVTHDHELTGHVGVRKTYDSLWPSIKSDVSTFFKSCHVSQLSGKPNKFIPPAPLKPIPVIGEPFERILFDCVGPLPKTKSRNSYLITLMCASTRYPKIIPLHSLKAHAIVKAIIKLCTTFGVPKYIKSNQGTNFIYKVFAIVIKKLNIRYLVRITLSPKVPLNGFIRLSNQSPESFVLNNKKNGMRKSHCCYLTFVLRLKLPWPSLPH